jgi:Zn-dependent peptidase ImmA (M78 family)
MTFIPPNKFKLGSRTWKVERVERRGRWVGKCSADRCRIRLNMRRIKSNEELRHTFFHELMHAICATMGWTRLDNDEDKIDAIGNLLAQVEQTLTWED